MQECLRQRHLTCYLKIRGDSYDRETVPRFSYTDRAEVC
jgi:hypothetical protein